MNRRRFLSRSGIVGAGILGAGGALPGLLLAEPRTQFKFKIGGKTRGIYSAPAAVPIRRS